MLETRHQVIKGREVVADDWSVLRLEEDEAADSVVVPEGRIIVPLTVWLAQRASLAARADIGVWIGADERSETLEGDLEKFAVVAVDFPKFTDGRGYSIAFNLRKRLGYRGELRAIGDVLRDQLFSMHRVGFDAYAPPPERDIHATLKGLTVFTETYQASVDQALPLFRRHARASVDTRVENRDVGYGI